MHRSAAWLAIAALTTTPALALAKPTLVTPIAGSDSELTEALTKMLTSAAEADGEVLAGTSRDDVLALAGCAAAEPTCLASAPGLLDVDRIILGEAEPDGDDVVVHLLLVEADGRSRQRDVALEADHPEAFAPQARAFLRDQPAPREPSSTPAIAPPPPAADVAQPDGGFSLGRVEPWTWGVTGTGVALLGVGGLLLASAADIQADVDAAPTDSAAELDQLAALEDTGRSRTRWGNVSLLVGAAAVAVGAVFIVRQGRSVERTQLSLRPAALGDGFGIALTFGGTP